MLLYRYVTVQVCYCTGMLLYRYVTIQVQTMGIYDIYAIFDFQIKTILFAVCMYASKHTHMQL